MNYFEEAAAKDGLDPADIKRFTDACTYAPAAERRGGIGVLREKALHAALKFYIDPDQAHHEIRLKHGIADVCSEDGVFEIQTRSFNALREKLASFLEEGLNVTVVHPIPAEKRLIWVDKATGDMTSPRRSPKHGSVYDAFPELYKLGGLLGRPGLGFLILLIDMDEYRFLDGWGRGGKRGSTRFERIPRRLRGLYLFKTPAEFGTLLPENLPADFTSRELAESIGVDRHRAQNILNVLSKLGVVGCVGRRGNAKLWEKLKSIK